MGIYENMYPHCNPNILRINRTASLPFGWVVLIFHISTNGCLSRCRLNRCRLPHYHTRSCSPQLYCRPRLHLPSLVRYCLSPRTYSVWNFEHIIFLFVTHWSKYPLLDSWNLAKGNLLHDIQFSSKIWKNPRVEETAEKSTILARCYNAWETSEIDEEKYRLMLI